MRSRESRQETGKVTREINLREIAMLKETGIYRCVRVRISPGHAGRGGGGFAFKLHSRRHVLGPAGRNVHDDRV